MPNQNAGIDCSITPVGTRMLSKKPPRRHAAIAPIAVPTTKEMTTAQPTSPIVQGSSWPIRVLTFSGYSEMDKPKWPKAVWWR